MNTQEAAQKVRQLKELQALINEAEQEAEQIKTELKGYMTAQGAQEMSVDVYRLRYRNVESSRFDMTAFKSQHSKLYEKYVKRTQTLRFSIA